MLADVRRLRVGGRKLPREEVKALAPVRGELVVSRRRDPWRDCWVPVALLVGDDLGTPALASLDEVRIARWTGRSLLLVGLEHRNRGKGKPDLQAWWVQLVSDPGPPCKPTSKPSE
jgi:hypothetical protein